MIWQHDQLLEDLALVKATPFVNVPLGSVWAGLYAASRGGKGTQIADVVWFRPSYTRFCLSIFEVKVSRADFLGDLRREKWRGYLAHCQRFYFAVPSGLVQAKETPNGAGLIVRGNKGWRTVKPALPQDIDVPTDTILSMLFLRTKFTRRESRLHWIQYQEQSAKRSELARRFGKRVAYAVGKQQEYEAQCQMVRWYAGELKRQTEKQELI